MTKEQTPQDANEATIGAVASTAGLGGWCSGVRALVCMYCHRRDMPTDGPALLPKPRITQDGDCAQHIDPPEKPKGGLAEAVKMARGGDAPIPFKRW